MREVEDAAATLTTLTTEHPDQVAGKSVGSSKGDHVTVVLDVVSRMRGTTPGETLLLIRLVCRTMFAENSGTPENVAALIDADLNIDKTQKRKGRSRLSVYKNISRRLDQVYRFLELLCNSSAQNPHWNAEDGQALLQETVKGNGILRLQDAIRFPKETDKPWSFQRGYIPILTYLTSEWVIKSTMHSDVNFKDGNRALSGKQVFKVIFVALFEYLTRFKQAKTTNPEVHKLVTQAAGWFDEWAAAVNTTPPFNDECSTYDRDVQDSIISSIRRDKDRVLHLVRRGEVRVAELSSSLKVQLYGDEGLIAHLQRELNYQGPGELREMGPRHDNDRKDFELIRIAPTHLELICKDDPYLPPNFAEAPHFLEPTSVERLLDVQFRLLREELIAPVRVAVQHLVSDLLKPASVTTTLSKLIKDRGGRYTSPHGAHESVMFSVFTNATFEPLELNNRGPSVGIVFDAPPGQARHENPATRAAYWEQVAKKRLMNGGLVALIWKGQAGALDVYIGTIASSPRDLVELAKKNKTRLSIRVSFIEPSAELRIVRALQNQRENVGTRVLIEAPIFYEGIRPFLKALQSNPGSLPFSQYLCHQSDEELKNTRISPPLYSTTPGFTFQLKDLFDPAAGVSSLTLTTNNATSVALARSALARGSRLDPSQAEAVVDSLTREVSLIQGPPGTGKSYTCLELIRVLIKNQIAPILLVAYTNHALDHMLKGILDAGITKSIIRLGSRQAADERIAPYNLEVVEKAQGKTSFSQSIGARYREMKSVETEMSELMKMLSLRNIPPRYIKEHVRSTYPHHYKELFSNPPSWISTIFEQAAEDPDGWNKAGKRQRDPSILGFWLSGRDLEFLRSPPNSETTQASASKSTLQKRNRFGVLMKQSPQTSRRPIASPADQRRRFLAKFFLQQGVRTIPNIPETTRALDNLRVDPNVWNMSQSERRALYDIWRVAAGESIRETQVGEFENLRQKHEHARRRFDEIKEQVKVNILRRTHIIGCTTTGAAKGIEPKVMVVEEAGQVLESHILTSLVQSVQHLVMIGDPLQLRPSVNSYRRIYRFDRSLMERLSDGGFPMSQLDIQRRMRPTISSLIKNTLYPNLQDHERVLEYPKVRGMYKDVFFVSHDNMEVSGGEDSISKHNTYELDMIYDLVLHLLRQGCYSDEGNIVILAAYLGQIPKIRKKLQGIVTTVVDERDSELLAQHGLEEEGAPSVQRVEVSSRVLVRTLDNFQGEEGEIIILSLVRNAGTRFDGSLSSLLQSEGKSRIGFLKSENRTNVGLSRAKHGMYIFGNAPELAQGSKMWAKVLRELHESGCVGKGLPMACHQHPDYVQTVDRPGQLKIVSPDASQYQMPRTLLKVMSLASPLRSQMLGMFDCPWRLMLADVSYPAGTPARGTVPNHMPADHASHVAHGNVLMANVILFAGWLPCDKKCLNKLKCGHPCPSVCGEPCAQQSCIFCTNGGTPDSIVDLVMHASLLDLEDEGTLDSMKITLPCQHIFTVAALDNITSLNDFYEKGQTGEWARATRPEPSGKPRARPVCPMCGGPISSFRYGRVWKSSSAAVMQHDIASSLSHLLASAKAELAMSRPGLKASILSATTACVPTLSATDIPDNTRQEMSRRLGMILNRETDLPTSVEVLLNLENFHAYTQKDSDLWRSAVGAILIPYQAARQIASDRDQSIQAYEASLKDLYQEELSHLVDDPAHDVSQEVEQLALRLARMRIGQPPPRANLRFVVEAFWVTIDILVLLGLATHEASGEIRRRESNTHNSLYWTRLAGFFFKRAVKDAEVALNLAKRSESWNKFVKCQVVLLRTQYELAAHNCRSAVNARGVTDPGTRASLVKTCEDGILAAEQQQATLPEDYLQLWENEEHPVRQKWVNENFTQPLNVILHLWTELKRSAESGTRYPQVTEEDRQAILDITTQGYRGQIGLSEPQFNLLFEKLTFVAKGRTAQFYQCPNGHPYVIGECSASEDVSRMWCQRWKYASLSTYQKPPHGAIVENFCLGKV
ncbi:hypothetical protein BDV93DRAFT_593819 [Ceratobasidium sp. AG-I]|nr:hypothetical protein BDV93DRAFT_593819 [Ceratobasidium sp. AG-I]